MTDWPKKPYRWIIDRTLYISVPFTWNMPDVRGDILQGGFGWDRAIVGGPAVKLMPDYLKDIAEVWDEYPGVLQEINPQATRSTLGCPNGCGFCGVSKIEGPFRELDDWPDRPIYCDSNILASSRKHFDKVIDRLKHHPFSDFNQGLDARLLTEYHAGRLAELRNPLIRLAWDSMSTEKDFLHADRKLILAGIPKDRIRCFVLIGYSTTPEQALYQFNTLRDLGMKANPMRYEPLDSLARGSHIDGNLGWTQELLLDYMKYWANDRFFKGIPFEEFVRKQRVKPDPNQKEFSFDQ